MELPKLVCSQVACFEYRATVDRVITDVYGIMIEERYDGIFFFMN
jgi:hypothetical protein